MATSEDNLVEELNHNAVASGNRMLERRMADFAIWFYRNIRHIPRDNLAARQAFLEKAMWIQLEMNALLLERLREAKGVSRLYIPNGMRIQGDVKEFG